MRVYRGGGRAAGYDGAMAVPVRVAGWWAVALAMAGGGGVAWGQRFIPGLDPTAEAQRVEAALLEVRSGDVNGATRGWEGLGELLRRGRQVLLSAGAGSGGVVGLEALLRELEPSDRAALDRAVREDVEMGREWDRVRAAGEVGEMLRFARRAGPTGVGGEALVAAAAMLEARGDDRSGRELRARAAGWGVGTAEAGSATGRSLDPGPVRGVLLDYFWFNKMPDRLGNFRSAVVREGDGSEMRLYVGSATHVLGLRGGQVVWGWPSVPAAGRSKRLVSAGPGRLEFPVYGVVEAGVPGVVLARGEGEFGGAIRALRTADGEVLWSTDGEGGDSEAKRMHFASMPAVAGGYAYALAADTVMGAAVAGAGGARLYLVGMELMTGRVMFKTALGALSEVATARGRGDARAEELAAARAPGLWDDLTAPAVDGDRVIVAPGGAVFAVDRFDGSVLRAAGYVPGAVTAKAGNTPSELAMSRWQSTPVLTEKVIVVGPRDLDAVMALDRRTLAVVWTAQRTGAYTVLGTAAGPAGKGRNVIMQGNELAAVGLADGKRGWQTAPRTQTRFTGPAVLVGEVIVVPTSAGPMAMSASTGQWLPEVGVQMPQIRAWFGGETGGILRAADVLAAFLSPSTLAELGTGGGQGRDESEDGPGRAGLPGRAGGGPQRIVPGPKPERVTPGSVSPPPIDARQPRP